MRRQVRQASVMMSAALLLALTPPSVAAGSVGESVWTASPSSVTREIVVVGTKVIVTGTYTDYSGRTGIETTALDRSTGQPVWIHRFGLADKTTVTGLVASDDGQRIYVRGRSPLGGDVALDRLVAISTAQGGELWETAEQIDAHWKPADILAADGDEHSVAATFTRPQEYRRTPTGDVDPVVTEGPDCRIVSRGSDGAFLWSEHYAAACPVGDVGLGDRVMLAGTRTRESQALNIRTSVTWSIGVDDGGVDWREAGRTKFGLDSAFGLELSPDGSVGVVLQGDCIVGSYVRLVGAVRGDTRWRGEILDLCLESATWAPNGRSVYLVGVSRQRGNEPSPQVQAVNAETGKTRWDSEFNGFGEPTAIAATDSGVYISDLHRFRETSPDGSILLSYQARVLAYSPSDGSLQWSTPHGSRGDFRDPDVAKPIAGLAIDPSRPGLLFMGGVENSQGFVTAFRSQ